MSLNIQNNFIIFVNNYEMLKQVLSFQIQKSFHSQMYYQNIQRSINKYELSYGNEVNKIFK